VRYLNPAADTADVLGRARELGLPEEVIGHAPDGTPIVAFRSGGDRQPAIVVSAGAHGDEPSGPLGALALLSELDTDRTVYTVPVRDPLGWNGYRRALGFALGRPVELPDHDAAEALLRSQGRVLLDEAGILIVEIGGLGFAFKRPAPDTIGPREIWNGLGVLLAERPELIGPLLGLRLILPSNLAGIEGCSHFDRAYTVLVTPSGLPGNLNRFFGGWMQPPEVAGVQRLFERVGAGLVLDLHEGQGSDFYLFVSGTFGDEARHLAETMIAAVAADGHDITTLERLAARLTPEIVASLRSEGPGILRGDLGGGDAGDSFSSFASRTAIGFTTETGRWTSLATRVQQQVVAVQATVAAFAQRPA
jgi:hypothetical protein